MQDKELAPRDKTKFYMEVKDTDEMGVVTIGNLEKNTNLRVSMTHLGKHTENESDEELYSEISETFDGLGEIVQTEWKKKLTKKGSFLIQVHNTSAKILKYSITAYTITKSNEENKSFELFRSTLQTLSSLLDKVKSENYYFNTQQNKNIKEAKTIRRMVNMLILFPILTALIGWLKHVIARHIVKPSKKKFSKVY